MKVFSQVVLFLVLLVSSAQAGPKVAERTEQLSNLLTEFKKGISAVGTQVLVVADPHLKDRPDLIYAEILSLRASSPSIRNFLETRKVWSKEKAPGANERFWIESIGIGAYVQGVVYGGRMLENDPEAGTYRSWSLLYRVPGSTSWTLPDKGIDAIRVQDGMIIGFSLTTWTDRPDGTFGPSLVPRLKKE